MSTDPRNLSIVQVTYFEPYENQSQPFLGRGKHSSASEDQTPFLSLSLLSRIYCGLV